MAILVIYSRLDSVLDTHAIVPRTSGLTRLTPASIVWEARTLLANLVITTSILWGLVRIRTGIAHTDRLLTRLMRMTLEAQVFATAIALVLLIDTSGPPPQER